MLPEGPSRSESESSLSQGDGVGAPQMRDLPGRAVPTHGCEGSGGLSRSVDEDKKPIEWILLDQFDTEGEAAAV